MDLHLIDLLEENQIDQVLDYIKDPKHFYACVLRRLISLKVPDVKEEWSRFKSQVKDAVKQAALATFNVNSGLAQTFVNNLRDEFSDGGLQSHAMASAFSIDCSGEYEESDNEDKKKFQEDCEYELNEAIENVISLNDHEGFSEELSPKVVQYMKTVNNQIALPRCDAHCPNCFSLCIEAFNHDTKHRPHDAIHQPGGVAGQRCRDTNKLVQLLAVKITKQTMGFTLTKKTLSQKNIETSQRFIPSGRILELTKNRPSENTSWLLTTTRLLKNVAENLVLMFPQAIFEFCPPSRNN
ncbi:hypothetical protein DAPPUDRAFT_268971 [Daphnia pulex]|uniref:Uncharacterized protein n=1 Tax=Daphnia pulex TaxID=6669 RepID=E9HYL1_DAPPU|nr:hypothetical protein DAPPUDRAFT_268971 [Daphnia pulex]|eukprot:EFX63171.1 hypothetical protein DAPPUDRAFT_268971 [Daphnia pulex]